MAQPVGRLCAAAAAERYSRSHWSKRLQSRSVESVTGAAPLVGKVPYRRWKHYVFYNEYCSVSRVWHTVTTCAGNGLRVVGEPVVLLLYAGLVTVIISERTRCQLPNERHVSLPPIRLPSTAHLYAALVLCRSVRECRRPLCRFESIVKQPRKQTGTIVASPVPNYD